MKQDVRPIKNLSEVRKVLKYLKNSSTFGIRNFMMFSIGMNCVLRISDIVNLKYSDVYTAKGKPKKYLRIREIKTGKIKELLLIHAKNDLIEYQRWLKDFINSQPDKYMQPLKSNETITVGTGKNAKEVKKNDKWLFPSTQHPTQHVSEKTFYKAMRQASQATGVEHLGTHTPRKTGAYLFYRGGFDDVLKQSGKQPNNDIALAMKTLNHSSEGITLNYLGLEQESINKRVAENNAFDIDL